MTPRHRDKLTEPWYPRVRDRRKGTSEPELKKKKKEKNIIRFCNKIETVLPASHRREASERVGRQATFENQLLSTYL